MITGKYPSLRLRRSRKTSWSRRLIQENTLTPNDFILPIFLVDGNNKRENIPSMPGVYRYTINRISQIVDKALKLGIPMVALFPKTKNSLKDEIGSESLNENNLVCQAILEIKKKYKNQIGIMCDVALDPYTSHGHDGLIKSSQIINDQTIEVLINQSLLQAEMGCDVLAPSDMMDGRIGKIRKALDKNGYKTVPQVGVGGFRIDLGVKHNDYKYGFLAGIECDGATFHSSPQARDRDVLRQEILEGYGWKIYRIWSTDWFRNSDREMEKLISWLKKIRDPMPSTEP